MITVQFEDVAAYFRDISREPENIDMQYQHAREFLKHVLNIDVEAVKSELAWRVLTRGIGYTEDITLRDIWKEGEKLAAEVAPGIFEVIAEREQYTEEEMMGMMPEGAYILEGEVRVYRSLAKKLLDDRNAHRMGTYLEGVIDLASQLGKRLLAGQGVIFDNYKEDQDVVMPFPEQLSAGRLNYQDLLYEVSEDGIEQESEEQRAFDRLKPFLCAATGLKEEDVRGWNMTAWEGIGQRFESASGEKLMGDSLLSLGRKIAEEMTSGKAVYFRGAENQCQPLEMTGEPVVLPKYIGAKRFANAIGRLFGQRWYQNDLDTYAQGAEYNKRLLETKEAYSAAVQESVSAREAKRVAESRRQMKVLTETSHEQGKPYASQQKPPQPQRQLGT